jgi:hypothetical protein
MLVRHFWFFSEAGFVTPTTSKIMPRRLETSENEGHSTHFYYLTNLLNYMIHSLLISYHVFYLQVKRAPQLTANKARGAIWLRLPLLVQARRHHYHQVLHFIAAFCTSDHNRLDTMDSYYFLCSLHIRFQTEGFRILHGLFYFKLIAQH